MSSESAKDGNIIYVSSKYMHSQILFTVSFPQRNILRQLNWRMTLREL
jgi:hypothetical protein